MTKTFRLKCSLLLGVKAKPRESQDIANVGYYTSIGKCLWRRNALGESSTKVFKVIAAQTAEEEETGRCFKDWVSRFVMDEDWLRIASSTRLCDFYVVISENYEAAVRQIGSEPPISHDKAFRRNAHAGNKVSPIFVPGIDSESLQRSGGVKSAKCRLEISIRPGPFRCDRCIITPHDFFVELFSQVSFCRWYRWIIYTGGRVHQIFAKRF